MDEQVRLVIESLDHHAARWLSGASLISNQVTPKDFEDRITESIERVLPPQSTPEDKKKLYLSLSRKLHPDKIQSLDGAFASYLRRQKLTSVPQQVISKLLNEIKQIIDGPEQHVPQPHFQLSRKIRLFLAIDEKINNMMEESDRYWPSVKKIVQPLTKVLLWIMIELIPNVAVCFMSLTSLFLIALPLGFDSYIADFGIKGLFNLLTHGRYDNVLMPYETNHTARYSLAQKAYIHEAMEMYYHQGIIIPSGDEEQTLIEINKLNLEKGRLPSEWVIKNKTTEGLLRILLLIKAIYQDLTKPWPAGIQQKAKSFASRALLALLLTPMMLMLALLHEGIRFLSPVLFILRAQKVYKNTCTVLLLTVLNAPLYMLDLPRFIKGKLTRLISSFAADSKEQEASHDLQQDVSPSESHGVMLYLMGGNIKPDAANEPGATAENPYYYAGDDFFDCAEDPSAEPANGEELEQSSRCSIS